MKNDNGALTRSHLNSVSAVTISTSGTPLPYTPPPVSHPFPPLRRVHTISIIYESRDYVHCFYLMNALSRRLFKYVIVYVSYPGNQVINHVIYQ